MAPHRLSKYLAVLLSLGSRLQAVAGSIDHLPVESSAVSTVFQFGQNPAWIENLAVRSNGNIVFTSILPEVGVWEIDPTVTNGSAKLITSFIAKYATGITELQKDIFVALAGNVSTTNLSGSWSAYTVDLRGEQPAIRRAADISGSGLLNGMTTLNVEQGTVLISDSWLGHVGRLNVHSGSYHIVLQDNNTMLPGALPPGGIGIGINGIRLKGEYLYYDNTGKASSYRIQVNADGTAAGPYEFISNGTFTDDFAVRRNGVAYGCSGNTVIRVKLDGSHSVIAGSPNATTVLGCTSAQFGRGKASDVLYVSTNGGINHPLNGTYIEPGKLLAIDLDSTKPAHYDQQS